MPSVPSQPFASGPLAAAAGEWSGSSLLALIGLGLLVCWLLSLLLHPFTACGTCQGTPRLYGSVATRSFRLCGTCGGTGRRLRVGAWVWPQNRG